MAKEYEMSGIKGADMRSCPVCKKIFKRPNKFRTYALNQDEIEKYAENLKVNK
ncbi:MAG: hypothetical protein ACE5RP_00270 [Nitrosopumilus sp.]